MKPSKHLWQALELPSELPTQRQGEQSAFRLSKPTGALTRGSLSGGCEDAGLPTVQHGDGKGRETVKAYPRQGGTLLSILQYRSLSLLFEKLPTVSPDALITVYGSSTYPTAAISWAKD